MVHLSNHYNNERKMIFQYIKRMDYRRLKGLLSNLAQINFFCNEGYGHTGSSNYEPLDITTIYDKQGFNPLHFAALNNSLKTIEILCEHVLKYGCGKQTRSPF